MIIGLSGLSGAGKSTVASFLVKNHDFIEVGFADPLKRIALDVYGFTFEQLWGSSEKRNEMDKRYPCKKTGEVADGTEEYLTPRYALQTLGGWGRECYENTWVDYALRIAKRLNEDRYYSTYTPMFGVHKNSEDASPWGSKGVVISDCRYINEFDAITAAGGKVIRIKRIGYDRPKWDHPSETEQMSVPDERFDQIIDNDSDLVTLATTTGIILGRL